jgi:hypothetical protein
MTVARHTTRVTVTEYGAPVGITELARLAGLGSNDLLSLLTDFATRCETTFRLRNAVSLTSDEFRVRGVAGMVRLGRGIELEIRPKFLDGVNDSWREDFLFIAMATQFGRVLPREALAAATSERADLSDLVARAMVQLFDRSYRRPLRLYRQRDWRGWEIDGEVDPESLYLPTDEGFAQEGLHLDKGNPFNRTISTGMKALLPSLRSSDARQSLSHRLNRLGPQQDAGKLRTGRLPTRHSHWQDLFDLCQAVSGDKRLAYGDGGPGFLPGFLLDTASAWESLMLMGARLGLPSRTVGKRSHPFGIVQYPTGDRVELNATPDISVSGGAEGPFIADAKYKAVDASELSRADLYELLAFMRAAGCMVGLLLYPSTAVPTASATPGETVPFARLDVDGRLVVACHVDVRGLSQREGLWRFGRRFGAGILEAIKPFRVASPMAS